MGRADYQRQYEPIWCGWRQGMKHHWCGDRDQSDVWEIARPSESEAHPTMKPLALVEHAINNSSKPGDVVLDLFLGSGSTLIAAERTGRVCYRHGTSPALRERHSSSLGVVQRKGGGVHGLIFELVLTERGRERPQGGQRELSVGAAVLRPSVPVSARVGNDDGE